VAIGVRHAPEEIGKPGEVPGAIGLEPIERVDDISQR
jgi:hypothetical protein